MNIEQTPDVEIKDHGSIEPVAAQAKAFRDLTKGLQDIGLGSDSEVNGADLVDYMARWLEWCKQRGLTS